MCLLQNNPVIYYDFSRYNGYNDKCKKCGDSWSTVVDDAESERLFLQLKKGQANYLRHKGYAYEVVEKYVINWEESG